VVRGRFRCWESKAQGKLNEAKGKSFSSSVAFFFLVEEAYAQQGRAHSRRLCPNRAARPALMGRHTPSKAKPWSASKSPSAHARPCLGCAVELALRVAPLAPPRRPTPVVRSAGGVGAHPPVPFGLSSPPAAVAAAVTFFYCFFLLLLLPQHAPPWVYAPISLAHGIGLLELLGNPNNTSLKAARRYLRVRGTARADSRRSGVGLAPRPQALPMPAAALSGSWAYRAAASI
jgi:hypothetical protein